MIKKMLARVFLVGAMLGYPVEALAQSLSATLSSGNGSGQPSSSGIIVPISLSSNSETNVTGLNFDLSYDTSRISITNVTAGSAASSAAKTLSWSSPSSGKIRVIIFGLNQNAISNGAIANLSINVQASAAPGTLSLSLSNAAATDASGSPVQLNLNSGSFTVTAPPATSTETPVSTETDIPTATYTSEPKTLPTKTQTPTATWTSISTVTATNTSVPTQSPSPTKTPTVNIQLPPTATRHSTSTKIPTATQIVSANSTNTATSSAVYPAATSTQQLTATPTNTPIVGIPPNGLAVVGLEDSLSEGEDQIEAAVAATGTALAEQVNPTHAPGETATLDQQRSGVRELQILIGQVIDRLSYDIALVRILILGTGIAGAILLTPLLYQQIRGTGKHINGSDIHPNRKKQ